MNQELICDRNYVLRKFLTCQKYSGITKDIIQSFLGIEIQNIEINGYIATKKDYLPSYDKFGVTDARIETTDGEEFNIGIQFLDGKHIQRKIALYYLYIHTNQIYYGDNRKIAKTITINFLDFPYYQSFGYHKKEILNKFKSIDFKEEEAEVHVIELPKFRVFNCEEMTKQEQWIVYLKGESPELMSKVKKDNIYIRKLDKLIKYYWENEEIE